MTKLINTTTSGISKSPNGITNIPDNSIDVILDTNGPFDIDAAKQILTFLCEKIGYELVD